LPPGTGLSRNTAAVAQKPRKRFGQNFLVDRQVIDQIIATVAPHAGELIIEIGPGRQALTGPLSQSGADLVVVELDRDLAAGLTAANPQYEVINEDALRVDFAALAAGRPYRMVGNLPYNISTPLLFHLLGQRTPPVDMHFMLQKEVVARMAASPGGKDFGRLSLTCQNFCQVLPLLEIPPQAFEPIPRVESAFVRLVPLDKPQVDPELQRAFETVVTQAFSMRRKTLRNSLRNLLDSPAIQNAGIDPGARPEQLGIDAFIRLARLFDSQVQALYDESEVGES